MTPMPAWKRMIERCHHWEGSERFTLLLGCCATVGGGKLISVKIWVVNFHKQKCMEDLWGTIKTNWFVVIIWIPWFIFPFDLFSMFVWPYQNILKHHFDTLSIFVQMFFRFKSLFVASWCLISFFLSHRCVSRADLAWCQPCTAKRSLSKTTQGFGSGIPLGWDLEEPKMCGS